MAVTGALAAIIYLLIVGLVLVLIDYVIRTYLAPPAHIMNIIRLILVLVFVLYALNTLGVLGSPIYRPYSGICATPSCT